MTSRERHPTSPARPTTLPTALPAGPAVGAHRRALRQPARRLLDGLPRRASGARARRRPRRDRPRAHLLRRRDDPVAAPRGTPRRRLGPPVDDGPRPARLCRRPARRRSGADGHLDARRRHAARSRLRDRRATHPGPGLGPRPRARPRLRLLRPGRLARRRRRAGRSRRRRRLGLRAPVALRRRRRHLRDRGAARGDADPRRDRRGEGDQAHGRLAGEPDVVPGPVGRRPHGPATAPGRRVRHRRRHRDDARRPRRAAPRRAARAHPGDDRMDPRRRCCRERPRRVDRGRAAPSRRRAGSPPPRRGRRRGRSRHDRARHPPARADRRPHRLRHRQPARHRHDDGARRHPRSRPRARHLPRRAGTDVGTRHLGRTGRPHDARHGLRPRSALPRRGARAPRVGGAARPHGRPRLDPTLT